MTAAAAKPALLLLAAVLFAGLGMFAAVQMPEEPAPGDVKLAVSASAAPPTEKTAQALAALSSGALDQAADAVAGIRGIVPAGDTCGMRRPNVLPPLPRSTRTVFAAASIAASPAARLGILDRLEATEPAVAWRVRLEKSVIARRAGDLERAYAEASAALTLDPPGTCVSDAWFSMAIAAEGDARTEALTDAVENDPGHYNAWARLAVDLMARMDAGLDPAECDTTVARIVQAIVYLDKLAKTDAQLARMERLANAASHSSSPARALLLGMIHERTTRLDEAADTYANLVARGGVDCEAPIELVASSRLAALAKESDP